MGDFVGEVNCLESFCPYSNLHDSSPHVARLSGVELDDKQLECKCHHSDSLPVGPAIFNIHSRFS